MFQEEKTQRFNKRRDLIPLDKTSRLYFSFSVESAIFQIFNISSQIFSSY